MSEEPQEPPEATALDAGIPIDTDHFPDDTFRQCVPMAMASCQRQKERLSMYGVCLILVYQTLRELSILLN